MTIITSTGACGNGDRAFRDVRWRGKAEYGACGESACSDLNYPALVNLSSDSTRAIVSRQSQNGLCRSLMSNKRIATLFHSGNASVKAGYHPPQEGMANHHSFVSPVEPDAWRQACPCSMEARSSNDFCLCIAGVESDRSIQ